MVFSKLFTSFLLSISFIFSLYAQTPPDLTADIPWDEDPIMAGNQATYADKTAIEKAFNNGRRKEETQKSLTANALGILSLPDNFTSLSEDAQALLLANAERVCRVGVNYGSGALTGLPFEAIETKIDGVSQAHMDWMLANNKWSHDGAGGLASDVRIANAIGAACLEFTSRDENLAIFGASDGVPPMILARSMYNWIYADQRSSWGHRQASLLQGFNNNRNAAASEGYLGWASGGKNDGTYNPVGFNYNYQYATVMNFIDPVATGCFAAVLPVELLSIDAKNRNNGIELSWTTTSEVNFKGYEIERSEDGTHFFTLEYVPSQGQAKSDKINYSFLDISVKPHLVYFYRLRLVDKDGKMTYSPVRSAILRGQKGGLDGFRLIASLATNTLSIENIAYESQEWTVQLFDISGKLILSQKTKIDVGAKQDIVLPATIQSGMYLARVSDGISAKTQKLVLAR